MRFQIEPYIFQQFTDLRIGVLSARRIDNHGEVSEIDTLLRQAEESLVTSFQGIPVAEHPRIAPWRGAYRKFGAKPKKHPSSLENLARRTLNGERIRHINTLVDLYTSVPTYIDNETVRYSIWGLEVVDTRARLLQAEELMSGDRYLFVRDAYLQQREYFLNDGVVKDDFSNFEEGDDWEEF